MALECIIAPLRNMAEKGRKRKNKKPVVLVLMPFHKDFDDIYELGIKSACAEAGASCQRVDEQIFETTVLEQIYSQMRKADIIISDMSGRNPNVFYETGYAHALGKTVILLTQRKEDIPFDLTPFPHIIYEGRIRSLKTRLTDTIKHYVRRDREPFLAANSSTGLIPRFPQLPSEKSRFFLQSNAALVGKYSIDDCIMLCHSPEYQGWEADEIRLVPRRQEIRSVSGAHNAYVQERKPRFRVSHKWKYSLLAYTLPLLDENLNRITLEVGYTDYATAASAYSFLDENIPALGDGTVFQCVVPRFFDDVGECRVEVASHLIPVIPCVDLTVLDINDKIVLLQRSKHVHFFPETWTATIEEQMNAVYKDQQGDSNILDTAKRSLREELLGSNMKDSDIITLKFLALLFNPVAFSLDIVGVVKLNLPGEDIAKNLPHRATDPSEHAHNYQLIDLSLDEVLSLVFPNDSDVEPSLRLITNWHSIARMRLLLTLLWRFGFEEVGRHPKIQKVLASAQGRIGK